MTSESLEGKWSPWGNIQTSQSIAEGIWVVSTAGHGGVKLSPERNQMIPSYMRCPGGWYEEDCEWAIPAVVFTEEFKTQQDSAKSTLLNWHPDEYAEFFNVELQSLVGKSYILDQRLFYEHNANKLIVTAAWGDWHETVPKGMVGVVAVEGGRRNSNSNSNSNSYFLVPYQEYDNRGKFGFVIEKEYMEWKRHP